MNLEDKALVALFDGLDTPGVSDALDKLGLPGQCLGIAPLGNYSQVVVGPAFTVQYVSASVPAGTVGDFIDAVLPGDRQCRTHRLHCVGRYHDPVRR